MKNRTDPKGKILTVGHINEKGEAVGFVFDCSESFAAGCQIFTDDRPTLYAGYTIEELIKIANEKINL